jgi:hypothetical protein
MSVLESNHPHVVVFEIIQIVKIDIPTKSVSILGWNVCCNNCIDLWLVSSIVQRSYIIFETIKH